MVCGRGHFLALQFRMLCSRLSSIRQRHEPARERRVRNRPSASLRPDCGCRSGCARRSWRPERRRCAKVAASWPGAARHLDVRNFQFGSGRREARRADRDPSRRLAAGKWSELEPHAVLLAGLGGECDRQSPSPAASVGLEWLRTSMQMPTSPAILLKACCAGSVNSLPMVTVRSWPSRSSRSHSRSSCVTKSAAATTASCRYARGTAPE